ncbi:hypothetical protein TNCV_2730191 [Trichonephila clavipes]|nr:hypothetical protein TNCV_2730191 [Trichonephila clavipes]
MSTKHGVWSTTNEWSVIRLFAMFRKGDMDINHKSEASRPMRCNVDYLWQNDKTRSASIACQLGYDICEEKQSISHQLSAIGMMKMLKTFVPHALMEEQHLLLLETCKSPKQLRD